MSSRSLALVFSGQGAHRKGMCMSLVKEEAPSVCRVWNRCAEYCRRSFGLSLHEIMQENPVRVQINKEALNASSVCGRSFQELPNASESSRSSKVFISHPSGVMHFTFLTQPCMVAAHLIALEYLKTKDPDYIERFSCIAGHSLGEFSALTALGVFSPEVAIDLTYKRGLLIESHLGGTSSVSSSGNISSSSSPRHKYRLYSCDPSKAGLDDDPDLADDIFFCLVELISRALSHTTSFVEVVNLNVLHKQYIVAGDTVALSVLGKCLDPFFRAQRGTDTERNLVNVVRSAMVSVTQDIKDGVPTNPNNNQRVDFVSSSSRRYGTRHAFHRFIKGPDDGFTPSLDLLTQLTLEEEGRSGLKRKTWFMPLTSIEIPFHSSHLRQPMDDFLPVVMSALPEEKVIRELLSVTSTAGSSVPRSLPLWITNLTGKAFAPFDKNFQQDVEEAITSFNIGEVRHVGRYEGGRELLRRLKEGIQKECVRDICTVVLTAQLAHPVMWIDTMQQMVIKHSVREVHEISPVRTLTEMFRRNTLPADYCSARDCDGQECNSENWNGIRSSIFESISSKCFPADKAFFQTF